MSDLSDRLRAKADPTRRGSGKRLSSFGWDVLEAADVIDARDAEIERLRAHVRTVHRLNGWSKSKGWWCSCGQWWASFNRDHYYDPSARTPFERRSEAVVEHAAHVAECCGDAQ